MRDIQLSVKRSKFRCDDPKSDEANNEFKNIRKSILERDDHTCQFCGFRSLKWQEVHHVDDNHSNNNPENLVTTCSLCHSCHHVGLSGLMMKGIMIYIDPSLGVTQAEINQLIRTMWIGEKSSNKELSMACISIGSRLYKQSVAARSILGITDAHALGEFLLALDDDRYKKRGKKLEGVYFYPFKDAYKKQLGHWEKEVFANVNSNDWHDIAKQKLSRWVENKTGEKTDQSLAKYLKENMSKDISKEDSE